MNRIYCHYTINAVKSLALCVFYSVFNVQHYLCQTPETGGSTYWLYGVLAALVFRQSPPACLETSFAGIKLAPFFPMCH